MSKEKVGLVYVFRGQRHFGFSNSENRPRKAAVSQLCEQPELTDKVSSPARSSGPLPRWQSLQEVPYPLRVLAYIASPYARYRADIDPARIALGTHPDHDVVLESEPQRGVGGFDATGFGSRGDDGPAHRLRYLQCASVCLRGGQRYDGGLNIGIGLMLLTRDLGTAVVRRVGGILSQW